jgi:hypothetical protein
MTFRFADIDAEIPLNSSCSSLLLFLDEGGKGFIIRLCCSELISAKAFAKVGQ